VLHSQLQRVVQGCSNVLVELEPFLSSGETIPGDLKTWFQAFAFKCNLYRCAEGKNWIKAMLLTAGLFPGGAVQVEYSLPIA
jgi:hypothetical protein